GASGFALVALMASPLSTYVPGGGWSGGVYTSKDAGAHWTQEYGQISSPINPNTGFETNSDPDPDTFVDGSYRSSLLPSQPDGTSSQDTSNGWPLPGAGSALHLETAANQQVAAARTGLIPVVPGGRYVMTEYLKMGSGNYPVNTHLFWYRSQNLGDPSIVPIPSLNANHYILFQAGPGPTDWIYQQKDLTAPIDANYVVIEENITNPVAGVSSAWIDNVQLIATTALPTAANYTQLTADSTDNI